MRWRMMDKCDCYHVQSKRKYIYDIFTGDPIEHDIDIGVCWGTKECDECSCGGDKAKCDFYPEVRERVAKKPESNTEKFLQLVKENPTLPIVPMVYYEVVGEDYGSWVGSFGSAYVGEYTMFYDRYFDDREEFKEYYYDYHDEELCEMFGYEPWVNEVTFSQGKCTRAEVEKNNKAGKLLEEHLDKIADEYFVKAIIVNINLPEVD
jgi:hypothetical protein